ncbi:Trypsin-like peptidase domain-containing protein [Marininema mesophilum]|uniref:Trypsin-like peptidase domain-containing protein n=1 Tax=Marininema mesophilum TaxID=1048340 RepID=A0A1H3CCB1_9BACL|nr:trypsin-like peptidase domain-containing protein [Marininema mesophilum]SDX51797.1 Trypsin-like peptidase domain-containing protein [Marininema mesophilum]
MYGSQQPRSGEPTPPPMKRPQRKRNDVYSLASLHPANTFVPIIRRVRNSVVSISALEQPQRIETHGFWQRFMSDIHPPPVSQNPNQQFGSGFVISPRGYILTNQHVIRRAEKIQITLYNNKHSLPATVVWEDAERDIAVLQVKTSTPLRPLSLGSSRSTEVGEWAVAIGNPLGLNHTVTLGVISGKDRPLSMADRFFSRVIQTDAAINPGNSGGPLLNILGQAIGINTLVVYPSQSISFAIPIDEIKPMIRSYIEKVSKGTY